MPMPGFDPKIAPPGYIDLRLAIESIRCRMFTSEIPPELLAAAEANLALAAHTTPDQILERLELFRLPAPTELSRHPKPKELIVEALRRGALTLFIYVESRQRVIPIPPTYVQEVLEKAGFLRVTREAIVFRLRGFYPRRLLNAVASPELRKARFENFAFCVHERLFDHWLAHTAHHLQWPLDLNGHRGRGRPSLVPIIKPIVKSLIDSGRWKQGMPLKGLVSAVQSKIKDQKVDRETVKKAMLELYRENGKLEYRYVHRKRRRASTRRRTGRRRI